MNTRWGSTAVLVTCAAVLGATFGCRPNPKTDGEPGDQEPAITAPDEDMKALADGNNAFAVDLYKQLAAGEKGNIIFSPYSIRTALAMAYGGARGKTAEEMRKALHFTLPDEKLHTAFGATAYQLKGGKDAGYELNVANSLWGQQGFPFRPEFLELTKTSYGAGFRETDFARDPEAARQEINRWVEEKTKDRIRELLKPGTVTPQSRFVLANALYFKGQWERPFDTRMTHDAKFRVTTEQTVPVRMMSQRGELGYGETDDAQLLQLPYRSSGKSSLAMVLVLPKAVGGLHQLEGRLSVPQLQAWLDSIWNRRGQVYLPRFQTDNEYDLEQNLHAIGASSLLGPRADFSGIAPNGAAFIQSVIHKAMVEINEEGTAAAAATAIGGAVPGSAPSEPFLFRADHPFLFLIYAPQTGIVLACGRCYKP